MRIKRSKIYKMKKYPHFDNRIHWQDVKHEIENPEYIKHHAFYPFISYTQEMTKYPKKYLAPENHREGKRDNPKQRKIMYSAHIDRYIYEYYAYTVNSFYNKYAKDTRINNCAVAYRNNHPGKNNIHHAKSAFTAIRNMEDALIIIGDFTSYFDRIDHNYLKKMLMRIMQVDVLPEDYYKVFRSITKHAWLELDDIRTYKGIDRKDFNKLDRIFTPDELRIYKKGKLNKNEKGYGIPQGSAISAVFSNVYLVDFDRILNDYITSMKGFYCRYCDDFIVVVPWASETKRNEIIDYIFNTVFSIPNLNLEKSKTQVFHYVNESIEGISNQYLRCDAPEKSFISYLGFAFDGKKITIRSKTIAKYYERMYRKIDSITKNNGYTKFGNKIPMHNLYQLYSYKGKKVDRRKKKKGNFLSYVDRALEVFGPNEAVDRDTKHAWGKMQKRLNKKHDK